MELALDVCRIFCLRYGFMIYEWISQWPGPLLKILGAVLLAAASICISLQMQKRELQGQLITCTQNSGELHETCLKDSKNQIYSCKQDYDRLLDDANKDKEKFSKLKAASQLKKSLENCEHNYTLLSTQIAIYDKQSKLIESVDSQIEQMDTCNSKLKEYCELRSKEKSLTEFERGKMRRLLEYLGCNKDQLSEHHYHRTFKSFNVKLKSLMDTKEMLIGLLIRAEFKEMEKAQEKEKHLPFTKCQFVCDLKEEDIDSGSGFFRRIAEGGWNVYQRIFCI